MITGYRERIAAQLRNGFETQQGLLVIWQAVCWHALAEARDHSAIRPLSTEARANWAKGVLEAHYPGRVYEVYSSLLGKAVEVNQLEVFEGLAVDEVARIELEDKFSAWV